MLLCNSKKYIAFFCHCIETRHFIDGWCVRLTVASRGIGGDGEDRGFSTLYFILPGVFYVVTTNVFLKAIFQS